MTEQPMKQYIALLDDVGIACLGRLMPGMISFVPVEGLPMQTIDTHQFLVTPVIKPTAPEPLQPVETPVIEEPGSET